MVRVALWLLGVGAADLVAGLSAHPGSGRRLLVSAAVGTATVAVGLAVVGPELVWALAFLAYFVVTLVVWIWIRLPATWSPARGIAGLFAFLVPLAALIATSVLWEHSGRSALLAEWVGRAPFPLLFGANEETFLLVVGFGLVLLATSNALVRLALSGIGWDVHAGVVDPAGRLIGPLERLLIFGFGMAGQLTAAGFVIVAKSLLVFATHIASRPSAVGIEHERSGDHVLAGSFISWTIGFAPLVFVAG